MATARSVGGRSDGDENGGRMGEMGGEAGEGMKWAGKMSKVGGGKIRG
jgi:hypothetical protein